MWNDPFNIDLAHDYVYGLRFKKDVLSSSSYLQGGHHISRCCYQPVMTSMSYFTFFHLDERDYSCYFPYIIVAS